MVSKVFESAEWLDTETLLVLKADAMTMKVRLTADNGGCAEFLPGGKYASWNTDDQLCDSDIMSRVEATSDSIESVFGVLDSTLKFASDNIEAFWYLICLACLYSEHIS